ncbi:hypothetical protein U1Q18_000882, partial [Sarracenia purpurea var. burkii]
LISDLVVVIVSAAIGGIIFSCLGQPASQDSCWFAIAIASFPVLSLSQVLAATLLISRPIRCYLVFPISGHVRLQNKATGCLSGLI